MARALLSASTCPGLRILSFFLGNSKMRSSRDNRSFWMKWGAPGLRVKDIMFHETGWSTLISEIFVPGEAFNQKKYHKLVRKVEGKAVSDIFPPGFWHSRAFGFVAVSNGSGIITPCPPSPFGRGSG
jgi:hypothetical protein